MYPLRSDVNHFSVYLMVADSLPPYGWTRNTFFKLVLINQVDRRKSIEKGTLSNLNFSILIKFLFIIIFLRYFCHVITTVFVIYLYLIHDVYIFVYFFNS